MLSAAVNTPMVWHAPKGTRECADGSCFTGPPSCEGGSYCAFVDSGTPTEGGVAVWPDLVEKEITILRRASCSAMLQFTG